MPTPTEQALRLVQQELKAARLIQGKMLKQLSQLGESVKGMQVALSERESDLSARHDQLNQQGQRHHERITRVERALKLRTA